MVNVKSNTWLSDLIEVYNELGGAAPYKDVYRLSKEKRIGRGASWTKKAHATIRRTVEDHAESSNNFRGHAVFYSVNGHGKGVWGLLPEYQRIDAVAQDKQLTAYKEGVEGISREMAYLRRSRDPRLVESRKVLDDYTCQACSFRLEIAKGKFVVDVHHLNPIGSLSGIVLTSIEDLVCLCPTCHRIAHTSASEPLPLSKIRALRDIPPN